MYQNLKNMLNCDFITAEAKAEIKQVLEAVGQKPSTGIRSLADEFVRIAKSKSIPLFYNNEDCVDADIFNWLSNATMAETPPPTGVWKKFVKNETNTETVLENAVRMSLAQAIVKFTEMLKNNEFNKMVIKTKVQIILLTITTTDGKPFMLVSGPPTKKSNSLSIDWHDNYKVIRKWSETYRFDVEWFSN
jgi:antitoxin component of RelBE/YafQ-DinJ toxin-antitoxin module